MRLWSLHPEYLDTKGLLAAWREGLLAQSVINKLSGGYTNHPQLNRFKANDYPLEAIGFYLDEIFQESLRRNFKFAGDKIQVVNKNILIPVNSGQLEYEFNHLKNKLKARDLNKYKLIKNIQEIKVNPVFSIVNGPVENWEKI